MLFALGQVVVTRNCHYYALEHGINLALLIDRHANGDDGDLCEADQRLNELAIRTEGRVFSCYTLNNVKFYVITEWDRSYTTVMLATDY
jgi:hypothetical protein